MSELVDKLHAIHDSLTEAGFRHAFGGAISLAYCIAEPRGTRDLDINVFVPAERAGEVAEALPDAVKIGDSDVKRIVRDGQTRVFWDETPIDLFLNNLPVHEEIADEIRWVPLGGREVPVLSCESLVFFKTFFNRTKDWADIEAIAELDSSILSRAAARVESQVGGDAEYVQRLRRVAGGDAAFDR